LQKEALEREPHNAKGACSLDIWKTCNEYVYDSDAPPPAPPKPKRKRGKKNVTIVPSDAAEQPQEQPSVVVPL
jgi:hypothetical protein